MKYKYGEFTSNQISEIKDKIRKQIYFLLVIVDYRTRENYKDMDVDATFNDLLLRIGGMNELFGYPKEIVMVSSLLEAALTEYHKPNFRFGIYRKLILDAGSEVLNIEEV